MSPTVIAVIVSIVSIAVNVIACFVHLYFRASVSSILERLSIQETKTEEHGKLLDADTTRHVEIWQKIGDLREEVARLKALAETKGN